jgi:sirohydrochlorin cobaltochelatase
MTRCERGVVLFAHGSRDPLWNRPMEAVAARMREIEPGVPVRCAYLELMQPDLASAVQELVEGGARQITVLPMFLGVGRHARNDLPELVAALGVAHPQVSVVLKPAIGEDVRVVALLAAIGLDP